jgi:streptogramin lyase
LRHPLSALAFIAISLILASSSFTNQYGSVAYSFSNQNMQAVPIAYGSYEMIQYPLPNGSSSPWYIAPDSLGRIWFVEQDPSALMMFAPKTDQFTQYLIPNGSENQSATPESVAVDQFDNVWFSELATNKLGELKNGSSNLTQYAIPGNSVYIGNTPENLSCGPTIVATDSLGNVWIACEFSNQIDEFFPKNQTFLVFDLLYWQSAPAGFVFDKSGNLWFTAADVNMLGHAVLNALHNGTSNGITEFAPMNSTYTFTVPHEEGPSGPSVNITSSLPTPSGIALSPDGTTLWITEHIDSSFDSYNINSKSLDRYWTSQTYDEYGFSVSFPNGIEIDSQGNVWIAEHYGNKIGQFSPKTGQLVEYPIPGHYGGPYDLALGPNGTVWFVEISGGAIGELKPVSPPTQSLSVDLSNSIVSINRTTSVAIPFVMTASGEITGASMNVSGISGTGILTDSRAVISQSNISFSSSSSSNHTANDTLTFTTNSLKPGIYDLTISATVLPSGVIYSTVLKVVVSNAGNIASKSTYLYYLIVGIIASFCVVGLLYAHSHRPRRPRMRRRFRARP